MIIQELPHLLLVEENLLLSSALCATAQFNKRNIRKQSLSLSWLLGKKTLKLVY